MSMHYAVQFVYLSPKTKYQKQDDYLEKRLEWVHSIHSSRHQFKITVNQNNLQIDWFWMTTNLHLHLHTLNHDLLLI